MNLEKIIEQILTVLGIIGIVISMIGVGIIVYKVLLT